MYTFDRNSWFIFFLQYDGNKCTLIGTFPIVNNMNRLLVGGLSPRGDSFIKQLTITRPSHSTGFHDVFAIDRCVVDALISSSVLNYIYRSVLACSRKRFAPETPDRVHQHAAVGAGEGVSFQQVPMPAQKDRDRRFFGSHRETGITQRNPVVTARICCQTF